jgi:hypothetical protein
MPTSCPSISKQPNSAARPAHNRRDLSGSSHRLGEFVWRCHPVGVGSPRRIRLVGVASDQQPFVCSEGQWNQPPHQIDEKRSEQSTDRRCGLDVQQGPAECLVPPKATVVSGSDLHRVPPIAVIVSRTRTRTARIAIGEEIPAVTHTIDASGVPLSDGSRPGWRFLEAAAAAALQRLLLEGSLLGRRLP